MQFKICHFKDGMLLSLLDRRLIYKVVTTRRHDGKWQKTVQREYSHKKKAILLFLRKTWIKEWYLRYYVHNFSTRSR